MTLQLFGASRSRAAINRWYLEEKGIAHTWTLLDLQAGEQRRPDFLAINPFGKVPALVDTSLSGPDGGPLKLFESGAILLHLAEHHGQEFSGESAAARRALTAQWLLFANATLGPALLMAESRAEELARLLAALEPLLADGRSLLAGSWGDPGWGAADCALQAYLAYIPIFCPQVDLAAYPGIQAAIAATQARPAYRLVMGQR